MQMFSSRRNQVSLLDEYLRNEVSRPVKRHFSLFFILLPLLKHNIHHTKWLMKSIQPGIFLVNQFLLSFHHLFLGLPSSQRWNLISS